MATVTTVPTRNGRSELKFESGNIIVDPMPSTGWSVIKEGRYVGNVTPLDDAENWRTTPLKVSIIKDEVVKPLDNMLELKNSLDITAEYPAMAVSYVEQLLAD